MHTRSANEGKNLNWTFNVFHKRMLVKFRFRKASQASLVSGRACIIDNRWKIFPKHLSKFQGSLHSLKWPAIHHNKSKIIPSLLGMYWNEVASLSVSHLIPACISGSVPRQYVIRVKLVAFAAIVHPPRLTITFLCKKRRNQIKFKRHSSTRFSRSLVRVGTYGLLPNSQ